MLAEWAALVDTFRPRLRSAGSLLPAAAAETTAAAAEAGLALLTRQSLELADPLQLDLAAAAEAEAAAAGDAPAAVTLDGLATAMRQQHPSLFAADSRADDVRDVDVQLRQVAALWDTLHRQQRFKHEPFEWVYEGLQPLLLPPLLRRRKLAPLTLSVVLAAVARRLGLALLPAPAEGGDAITAAVEEGVAGGAAAHSQLPLEQLRPDVAQRYAGRTQGMAPAAAPWVLLLPAATGGGGGAPSWTHVVDACTGEALALTAVQQRFPELQLVSAGGSEPELTQHVACFATSALRLPTVTLGLLQAADWRLLGPLVAWQHMVRLMIQVGARAAGLCSCCTLAGPLGGAW